MADLFSHLYALPWKHFNPFFTLDLSKPLLSFVSIFPHSCLLVSCYGYLVSPSYTFEHYQTINIFVPSTFSKHISYVFLFCTLSPWWRVLCFIQKVRIKIYMQFFPNSIITIKLVVIGSGELLLSLTIFAKLESNVVIA